MTGPDPAVAAVRLAVRREVHVHEDGPGGKRTPATAGGASILVACSGGADSLALLAAAVFETRRSPYRVIGVVVDHGLQAGSSAHTARVVEQMASLGVDETASIRVRVDAGPRGVEAGAREARYAALGQLAEHFGAPRVLLGHTRDDQAETVLLGLTRGSGGRSIQGMRRRFGREVEFLRPLLDLTREQTEAACRAEGIEWWEDPHNTDPRFVRSRIRHTVMPMLEEQLGPGVAAALARTADSVRDDVEFLDEVASDNLRQLRDRAQPEDGTGLSEHRLLSLAAPVRHRVLRLAMLEAGAPASELTRAHVLAVAGVLAAREEKQIRLPGHLTAYVGGDLASLRFGRTPPGDTSPGTHLP